MTDIDAIPEIRFKGFSDTWEQRKLGDVFTIRNEKNGDRYSREDVLAVSDNYGCVNQIEFHGRSFAGEDISNYKVVRTGDIVYTKSPLQAKPYGIIKIVGEETGIISPLYVVNETIDGVDSMFMYYLFDTPEKTNNYLSPLVRKGAKNTMNISNDEWLSGVVTICPNEQEQQLIGEFFRNLDHLITLHQRKLGKITKVKMAMLEKMFPKNGSDVPEIRFKGFTDVWKQRKLGELYAPLNERNNDLLPYEKTLSVATMTYKSDGNGAADSSLTNYKRLRIGDIAFEGHTSKEFRYGRFVLNDVGDGIMSPRFSALRPMFRFPVQFWKYYIHYEPIMKKVLVNSTKAGTMMNELVVPEFLQESILVPSIEEQQQIGAFFKKIDHLITLHQRELEKLQNIKKSMLEKMFPTSKSKEM